MLRVRGQKLVALLLMAFVLSAGFPTGADASPFQRRRNPEAGKKKAAKRIGIGTAIGAGAGALIGGKKGALIGAGAGAGGGYIYHEHKKSTARRRYRR
jgi:hypothetical protein